MATRKQKKATKTKSSKTSKVAGAVGSLFGSKKGTGKKRRGKSVVQLANQLAKIRLKRKIRREQLKGF